MASHLRGPVSKEKYKSKRRDNEILNNRSGECSQKQRYKRGNSFLNHHILQLSSNSVLYCAFSIMLSLFFLLSIYNHSDFHVHGFITSSTNLLFSDRSVNAFTTSSYPSSYTRSSSKTTTMFLYHSSTNAAKYLSKFQSSSLPLQSSNLLDKINIHHKNQYKFIKRWGSERNSPQFANQSSDTTEKKRNISSKGANRNTDQDSDSKSGPKTDGKNK